MKDIPAFACCHVFIPDVLRNCRCKKPLIKPHLMKHLLLSGAILLSIHLNAQTSSINGKIKNLSNSQDMAFKIVFIRDHQRADSALTSTSGAFNSNLPAGIYDIELSKAGALPTRLEDVFLHPGEQAINISVKFTSAPVAPIEKPVLPLGDSVKHVSYFYIKPIIHEERELLTPPFMRRKMDDDVPSSAYNLVYTKRISDQAIQKPVTRDTSDSKKQINMPSTETRLSMSAEIIASTNWYVTFYPNPASETLYLTFSEQVESIRITDLFGKVLYESSNNGLLSMQVNVGDWDSGVYIVSTTSHNETIKGKLVIKH